MATPLVRRPLLLGHHDGRNWRDTLTGEVIRMITYPDGYRLTKGTK